MTPQQREQEQLEDERVEREIEASKIRVVWDGDNGHVPKPKAREEKRVKFYRPRV